MIEKNSLELRVKLGTSGYSYDDWRGYFYPPEIPKNKMLDFYSQYFKISEINSSYYQIPKQSTIQRMAEKTPEDFEFIIKVNKETTHVRRENQQAVDQLLESLKPMMDADKFRGLLAQFPYSFKNREDNRKYLAQTRKFTGSLPLFVEFRHESWNKPQIHKFLQELNISYVNVDGPQLPGLLPPQSVVTTETGYVRLHGRNEEKWWDGKGMERYDYLYNEEELKTWLTQISEIMRKTYKTYIFFNNHPNGQAVKNARQMLNLLDTQLKLGV